MKLVYNFINFIIPLPATYVRHFRGNCQSLPRRLVKQIERIARLLRQKDCRGTAEVKDAFKLLPRQLYCRRLYSRNSNAVANYDKICLGY